MNASRAVPTAAVALAVALGSVPSVARSPIRAERIGHVRVEKTLVFKNKWGSSCESDVCGTMIIFRIPATTPANTRKVDVTMTVTFDYKTGPEPEDFAVAGAGYLRRRRGRTNRLWPSWRLAPAPKTDTRTVVWQKHDLRAAGRRYFFEMSVPSREGGVDDNENFVRGKHLTVVIEMWPADN